MVTIIVAMSVVKKEQITGVKMIVANRFPRSNKGFENNPV